MQSLIELSAAKHEKVRRDAAKSFWHFRLLLHPKLKKGWFHKEMSIELQQFYDDFLAGKRPQLVIQAPPQHGKSVVINDFLIWIIGKDSKNPQSELKLIYAAFSDGLSTRANRRIQRYINAPEFKWIFPNFKPTNPVTQNLISYGQDGYFLNTTTGGAITGQSMDIGIIDDPVKGRESANSETIREKTWEWFTSDFSTRFSDQGAFLCILTRWHIDDVIGRLIDADPSVKVLRYPAIAERDEPNRKQGEPLFPEHKSIEFLDLIRQRMPAASWNSLYQQNPTLAEGNFFKPDFIEIVDAIPEKIEFCRAWDFAATANGGDYTVGLKLGYDKASKTPYVVDIVRGQYGPEDVERLLLNTAKSDGRFCKIRLPQDPGQAGKAQVRNLTRLLSGYPVIAETVTGDKETRAAPAAAQANIGNLKMLRSAWNKKFTDELRLFPNGVNDDQVDGLSDAYNHFTVLKIGSF